MPFAIRLVNNRALNHIDQLQPLAPLDRIESTRFSCSDVPDLFAMDRPVDQEPEQNVLGYFTLEVSVTSSIRIEPAPKRSMRTRMLLPGPRRVASAVSE